MDFSGVVNKYERIDGFSRDGYQLLMEWPTNSVKYYLYVFPDDGSIEIDSRKFSEQERAIVFMACYIAAWLIDSDAVGGLLQAVFPVKGSRKWKVSGALPCQLKCCKAVVCIQQEAIGKYDIRVSY